MVAAHVRFFLFAYTVWATSNRDSTAGGFGLSFVQLRAQHLIDDVKVEAVVKSNSSLDEGRRQSLADSRAHWQFESNIAKQSLAVNQKKSLAIVSAMFGGRDTVTLPPCPTSAHCVLFTDDVDQAWEKIPNKDLVEVEPVETMTGDDLLTRAKLRIEENGYSGFSIKDGTAYLMKVEKELKKDDLKTVKGVDFYLKAEVSANSDDGWYVDNTPHHKIFAKTYQGLDARGPFSWGNFTRCNNDKVRGLMAAKFYKMNAHLLPGLRDSEIILWIDANFWDDKYWEYDSLNPNILENLRTDLQHSNMMIPKHTTRNTVAEEFPKAGKRAQASTGCLTGRQDAQRAFEHEIADGFTDDQGLFWCELFAYKTQDRLTRDALRAWWFEVQSYSFRDQISFPYIKYKFDLELHSNLPAILTKELFLNGRNGVKGPRSPLVL